MELSTPCGCASITVPETSTSALTIQSNSLDVDDSILLDITSRDDESTRIEGTCRLFAALTVLSADFLSINPISFLFIGQIF